MEKKKIFTGSEIAPHEAVGVVCAQSIGEPGTQMSIASDEKVIVKIGSEIKNIQIGIFIDEMMQKHGTFSVSKASTACNVPDGIFVPSLDQNGHILWKPLVQVSRHKTNKNLLKITTRSGRSIIATDNHSFVIRENGAIKPILGSRLQPGDRIPAVKSLRSDKSVPTLDLSTILAKDEIWFGGEFKKAALGSPNYTIPVSQSQLFNQLQANSIEDGFVYPYMNHSRAGLPEQMPLDSNFGWFVGAYLSEGNATKYHVNISNTDQSYLANARNFALKLDFSINEYDNYRGFSHGDDLRINSSVLSKVMKTSCGHLSANKKIPEFAFNAPLEFTRSLLKAYFDGDGNINVQRRMIRAHSKSKDLIDGVSLLLGRFGIFTRKHVEKGIYCLTISYKYAKLFRNEIGSDIDYKSAAIAELCNIKRKETSYDVIEMITGFGSILKDTSIKLGIYKKDALSASLRKFTRKQKIGLDTLSKYTRIFAAASKKKGISIEKELSILNSYLNEDVVWDEIAEIREYEPENRMVYDFSVPDLETFMTFDGLITHNTMRTFHFAGVAEHVPTGLPRLIEIVDAKKIPKKPIIDIYLKKEYAKSSERADEIAKEISAVFVRDTATVEDDLENLTITVTYNEKDGKAQGVTFSMLRKVMEQFSADLKVEGNRIIFQPAKDKPGKTAKKKKEGESAKPETKKVTAKYVRKLCQKIRDAIAKGVAGISRAIVVKGDGEYFIRAGGYNVIGASMNPAVDADRVYTNNLREIERVYGIEAARKAILKEIRDVMEMQKLFVDIRHIMLIADAMTFSGVIKPIGRHGLSGEKVGVLGRAAFEETIKHLINACAFSEEEKLIGVTENIIVGQTVPVGTGKIKLMMKASKSKK